MNAALYFLCLILLLLIAAMATFGLLIGSLVNFGIWGVFKALAAPLYDPFGREFWMILLLLNPFGFCAIAAIGILCGAFVVKVYPNDWGLGSVLLFIPGMVSIGLSI